MQEFNLSPLNDYALKTQQIEQGIVVLKKRQRNLMLLAILMLTIFIASVVSFFLQDELIYSFFGLTTEVKQLHIVPSLNVNIKNGSDYFLNLLSWFGWFILKVFVSFIGAFFIFRLLKKIRFFYVRFKSFVLKFVAWLIVFITIWSSLTYLQYDWSDQQANAIQKIVKYENNIQESEIAQYLKNNDVEKPIADYLLAQTALLHHPADKGLAMVFTQRLIKAEQSDSQFLEYGFKPEQVWTLQHQLFGKSMTPLAQSVEKQVLQAELVSKFMKIFIYALMIISFVISLFFYALASRFKMRTLRIEKQMF